MTSYGFEVACKKHIIEMLEQRYSEKYEIRNLHLVWFSKTLQNMKAIIIDSGENNRMYECTLDGEKEKIYIDTYEKQSQYIYSSVYIREEQ